jgi:ABC-2 type transport system ATP-binding protein
LEINVKNITHSYSGITVFDSASFSLKSSKIYGLIGENGSGKTTLISILANILRPQSGNIENIFNPGLLLQGVSLYQNLSVMDNLELFVLEKRLNSTLIEEALELTGFPSSHYKKTYKSLSQGYKQRLAIVQAFLTNGNLVLLDEPFSTVDLPTIRILKKAIKQFADKTGKTVLISSHQLKEVGDMLDETLVIRNKKVINLGTDNNFSKTHKYLYLTCKDGDSLKAALVSHPQLTISRRIDNIFEIELEINFEISETIKRLEARNLNWTRIETNPPMEFLFYQKDDYDK